MADSESSIEANNNAVADAPLERRNYPGTFDCFFSSLLRLIHMTNWMQ